jgi:hypothetical protein
VRIAELEGQLMESKVYNYQVKPSPKCIINLLEDDEDGEAKQVWKQTTRKAHNRRNYPDDPRNGHSYQSDEYRSTYIDRDSCKNATDSKTDSIKTLTTSSLAIQNTMDYLEHLASKH